MNGLEKTGRKYRLICNLTFGDIYGQLLVWLGLIFLSLAMSFAIISTQPSQRLLAMAALGLILVLSLPFLLFGFVTTLFNHIEVIQTDGAEGTAFQAGTFTRTSEPTN